MTRNELTTLAVQVASGFAANPAHAEIHNGDLARRAIALVREIEMQADEAVPVTDEDYE